MVEKVRAYMLPLLGLRVFYTTPGNAGTEDSSHLTYYSHKHPYFELHIIEEGTLLFQAGEERFQMRKGGVCLIYPETVHAPASNITGVSRGCLGFELTDTAGTVANLLSRKNLKGYFTDTNGELLAVWQQLKKETGTGFLGEEMVSALLTQLLVCLVRAMEKTAKVQTVVKGSLDQLRTVQIDTFLNNRFFLTGGESILAEELGVSRRQLDRIFQKLYGMSYRQKLMEVRGEAACDMLKGTLPIWEIAQRVGYGSSSNFTAFFKGLYGITPTRYREKCRK